MENTLSLSWRELHRDARVLAARLADRGSFSRVIGIARGGLVPATIVACELDIRLVDTICLASYEGRVQGEPRLLKTVDGDGDGTLIVDDLVDTGVTARLVREMLPKAHFATVYAKPAGLSAVDTFVRQIEQETWIVFPWDDPRAEEPPP